MYDVVSKSMSFGVGQIGIFILALPLTNYLTWGSCSNSLDLSVLVCTMGRTMLCVDLAKLHCTEEKSPLGTLGREDLTQKSENHGKG